MVVVPVKFIGVHRSIFMEHIPFFFDLFPCVLNGFSVFLSVVPFLVKGHPLIREHLPVFSHNITIYKGIFKHFTATIKVIPFLVDVLPLILNRNTIDVVVSDSVGFYEACIFCFFSIVIRRDVFLNILLLFILNLTFSTRTYLFSCCCRCLFLCSRGDSGCFACRHF